MPRGDTGRNRSAIVNSVLVPYIVDDIRMSETPEYAVEATRTSLEILETLVETPEPMGVTALSDQLDVAKSVAHNHLSTLRAQGYVVKRDGQYEPSLSMLSLGKRARSDLPIYQTGKEAVDNLATATGETATLFIREENYAVPVYIAEDDVDWTPRFHAGDRLPLHVNAPGKCLMASMSDDKLETMLEKNDRESFTDATITDSADLMKEVRRIRDDGAAFCRGEHYEGIVGIAATIPTTGGCRTAALGVTGPVDRLNGRYLEEDITGQVLSTTKSIQVTLTGN
ncbi:IclR family transcriptional regulator [Natrinema salinisoli]|uniref:IclR family transcriptional regulator n=1 Tax=Natrinema salinisoli TaxID=2878535 RepID=UPI001CEFF62E|nr:IclR family transcriptional regulator [Natrinema salinisoli]